MDGEAEAWLKVPKWYCARVGTLGYLGRAREEQ